MKSDIRINYSVLYDIYMSIKRYVDALKNTNATMKSIQDIISQSDAEAIDMVGYTFSNVYLEVEDTIEALNSIADSIEDYINAMTSIIEPLDNTKTMQVDSLDIKANLVTMEARYLELKNIKAITPIGGYVIYSAIANVLKEKAAINNYKKLAEIYGLISATADLVSEEIDEIKGYVEVVEEYEACDDEKAKALDDIYDRYTNVWERVDNINDSTMVMWSKGSLDCLKDVLGGIIGLFKVYALGEVAIFTQMVCKENPKWTNEWIEDMDDTNKGIVNHISELFTDPFRVVEGICQTVSDKTDEKGIIYSYAYIGGDITIGMLIDRGISAVVGKLKGILKHADDVVDDVKNIPPKDVPEVPDVDTPPKDVPDIDDVVDESPKDTPDVGEDIDGDNGSGKLNSYGIDVDNLKFSNTVQNHTGRPYQDLKLLINEIMESKAPMSDPRGTNALSWTVEGTYNGSKGYYELIIDPTTNTVWHFVFKSK